MTEKASQPFRNLVIFSKKMVLKNKVFSCIDFYLIFKYITEHNKLILNMLSPKGEFLKERTEGSLWFECLSFTLSYLDLELNFPIGNLVHLLCGRADGRADGRIFRRTIKNKKKFYVGFVVFLAS